MNNVKKIALCIFFLFFLSTVPGNRASGAQDESFIRGYASAILQRIYTISNAIIRVDGGVLYVESDEITPSQRSAIVKDLSSIQGVARVQIAEFPESADVSGEGGARPGAASIEITAGDNGRKLFAPLLADPLWPHFSVGYQNYSKNGGFENVASYSVGGMLPVIRGYVLDEWQWQFAFHAAAHIIHDRDAPSWDLISEDYIAGIALSLRKERVSALVNLSHLSSHIGDEFLINNDVERINVSFEKLEIIGSYDYNEWLRLYGGGSLRYSRKPPELEQWALQYGAEFRSPRSYIRNMLRPVAAADVKHYQEHDWNGDISLRAGFQIMHPFLIPRDLMLTLGYYNGHSPHTQFYMKSIELTEIRLNYYY